VLALVSVMKRFIKIGWGLCLFLLLMVPGWRADAATLRRGLSNPNSPGAIHLPDGFRLVMQDSGVQLFRKDYPSGTPDYVEVIRLDKGAAIQVLHGAIAEPRTGKGAYGGDDPSLFSHTIQDYWSDFSSSESSAFCVTNGQFFYMQESPTRLPFPLKVGGNVISDGYALNDFPGKKLMLELWDDHAQITPLSQEALYNSTAPDIVAGLAEDAPKNIKKYVGRTFVGLVDQDGNGRPETVLIFNTRSARQVDAAGVLYNFGAAQVMMLDGGGSTQLICRGEALITTERYIPQALGVMAASPESEIIQALAVPSRLENLKITTNQFSKPTQAPTLQPRSTPARPAGSGLQASLQQDAGDSGSGNNFLDVVWVPVTITPMAAFLLFLAGKLRRAINNDQIDIEDELKN
jgi:Phosphodiester glycosidase